MHPAQQNTLLKIIKPPWEECPACGVRMEKIKYAPVDVDEGEGAEKSRPDNRPALLRERMCSAEVFFV